MAQGGGTIGTTPAGIGPPTGGAPSVPAAARGYSLFPSLVALVAPAGTTPAVVGSGPGAGTDALGSLLSGFGPGPSGQGAAARPAGPGAPAPAAFAGLIDQVAAAHGIPATLLTALVRQESGFDPNARSPVGAMGLTQLMPQTAAALGVQNPWDPVENLNGGAAYLAGLLKSYGGSVPLALAAYNAGPGAVSQWGGIPPYAETRAYVRNVMQMAGLTSA